MLFVFHDFDAFCVFAFFWERSPTTNHKQETCEFPLDFDALGSTPPPEPSSLVVVVVVVVDCRSLSDPSPDDQ